MFHWIISLLIVNYETANIPYRHLKSVQVSVCKHVYECVIECITELCYKWHVANLDAPLTKQWDIHKCL